MKNEHNRHHSLFRKISVPLAAVILFQAIIFFCATFYGGISDTINQNARDVLTERVINRASDIQTLFTTQWTNFSLAESRIYDIYEDLSSKNNKPVYSDVELQKKLLMRSQNILVNMIRSNEVTGVFLILNDAKEYKPLEAGTEQHKYGLCIRDYSPTSEYKEREDLLLVRCPSAMIAQAGCSLETWWDALFCFDDQVKGNYFYKPMEMAYANPGVDNDNLAYFDGVHNFGYNDRKVFSYSIPLMDEQGYPYAVLGVELTVDYLKTLMPASNLYGDNAGCYALLQHDEETNQYNIVSSNGILFQQCFENEEFILADSDGDDWFESEDIESMIPICGSIHNIQIYNLNTPYEHERLALAGFVKKDALYGINTIVRDRLLMVSAFVMVFGLVCMFLISRRVTKPINQLSGKVHKMDTDAVMQLDRLNIDEIDELVKSIEELNDKVNRTVIRTEFFSRMSHDMRTPMNAIIGFSSPELLETATKKEMQEYMEKIHTSGSFLLTLINDVLDMTKIETQRMELREEVLSEKTILDSFVDIIYEVAKASKVHFEIDTDDTQTLFWGDKQRICQIMMNLLSNAVKFCDEGGHVSLSIRECHIDKNFVTHRIIVSDDGCGISEEFQKRMYEPFAQEGKSDGGTGLGLAITYHLLMLMGGTIHCQSACNQGTTFTVTLSSRLAEGVSIEEEDEIEVQSETDDAPEQQQGRLDGNRVLLCEDHPINAQIASKLLERVGVAVELAHDGAEGVSMFEQSSEGWYQMILMDIRMPKMNGIEAAKAIRSLHRKDAAQIPIIAMTANAFKEDMEETKNAGMNEHLSKPIDPQIFYETLHKFLEP